MLWSSNDEKEEVTFRNPIYFADFFDIYKVLSKSIPHVSSSLYVIEFYLARGQYALLPHYTPSFDHLDFVRDERTLQWILALLPQVPWKYLSEGRKTEDLVYIAFNRRSYGLLKLIEKERGISLSEIEKVKSLNFSSDILSVLKDYVPWNQFSFGFVFSTAQEDTLQLALSQGYLPYKGWKIENIAMHHYSIVNIILPFLSIVFKDMDELLRTVKNLWSKMHSGKQHDNILNSFENIMEAMAPLSFGDLYALSLEYFMEYLLSQS